MPDIYNEDKEKFNIKMSDEELVNQIRAWEAETEDFYSQLKRVWEKNLLYYKGIQTDVEKIRGRLSRAVENRIFMAVETMIPIVSARLPEVSVLSGSEDERGQMDADNLQDILLYHFERLNVQQLAERWVRDVVLKRYGVFKIYWDKIEDDVCLTLVDPRRIKIPRYGKDVKSLAFIIEELEVSYKQLVDYFGKVKADEVLKNRQPEYSENKKRKKTFAIQEVWTNDFVVWRYGNLILDKKKNPFWNFENESENFLFSPSKPYVIKSLFETEESIIGDTDYIQQVIPIQDNINIRKRQIEDIINKVANPILLIDSSAMSEEEAANITNEPGLILHGAGAADGTKINYLKPSNIPNDAFVDLQNSRNEFDNIWGIHSTTRGQREGKETLGGRILLRQADLGRIDLLARQLERAMREIAEWWTQLIKLYYDEERTFSIAGEDGIRFIKNFSKKNVNPDIRLRVVAGSTLPKDEVSIHQEAIMLWQLGAIGVKTLYKMLRLPNPIEAIDDYILTRSGQIFANQSAETPLIPPSEPSTLLKSNISAITDNNTPILQNNI